jgi:hypothetical protein
MEEMSRGQNENNSYESMILMWCSESCKKYVENDVSVVLGISYVGGPSSDYTCHTGRPGVAVTLSTGIRETLGSCIGGIVVDRD